MRAASRRGRTRVLLTALAAVFLLAPSPVGASVDSAAARTAELSRLWDKMQGTPHVHADGSTHYHAGAALDNHDLALLGLRPGSGPCAGIFEFDGAPNEHVCSHGPDPAPHRQAGTAATNGTAALALPPPPSGWVTPTKIPCYTTGPFVEILWVYVTGTTSHLATYAEYVRRDMAAMDEIYNLSAKMVNGTNGLPSTRHIKFAHDASCNPKITNVSVSSAHFGDIGATKTELVQKSVIKSTTKYLAFLDAGGCGGGIAELAGSESTSSSNPSNLGGSYGQVDGCFTLLAPYYDGASIGAHELMHTLGAVQDHAPHTTLGHCWDDDPGPLEGADIMCYDDGYNHAFIRPSSCPLTTPETLDCNKDDYFNPNPPTGNYLKTHWNPAGNKFLSSVEPESYYTIKVPTASISTAGPYIGGLMTINATTTAPAGARPISRVSFTVNGVSWGDDTSAPYSFQLDSFQYTNLANVKVIATPYDDLDYPGVPSSATYIVANPQVHLDSPTEFSFNSPILDWTAKAAGFGGRTITKVQLTDGYGTPVGPADLSAPYGGTVDLSTDVVPGSPTSITLGLEVTDSAGVVRSTEAREVFIGGSTVMGPYSDYAGSPTEIAAGSQTLVALVTPPQAPAVSTVEFYVDDVYKGQDSSAPYSLAYTAVGSGATHEFVARAMDPKGFASESVPTYFHVSELGIGGTLTAPLANATVSGPSVTVTASPTVPAGWTVYDVSAWDPTGYGYAGLAADNAGNPNGSWSGALDSTSMGNGWHILWPSISASEDACCGSGSVYGRPIFIKVANTAPTLALTAPANGAKVKQSVNLTASLSGGPAYAVEFYVGGAYVGYDDTAPYAVPWDTMTGSDGTVRVTALAYTDAGDVRSPARFYSVRNLYAFMSAPTPGQTISGQFLLKGGGRCDRDCSLETATFFVDGVAVNYDRVAPYQFSLDTTHYANGSHHYAITITTNDYRAVSSAIYEMTISN
jgi:hypothetical protein